MAATLRIADTSTTTVRVVIDELRRSLTESRDAARQKLSERGLDPVGESSHPPSDAELRHNFWWYEGGLETLNELVELLEDDATTRADGP